MNIRPMRRVPLRHLIRLGCIVGILLAYSDLAAAQGHRKQAIFSVTATVVREWADPVEYVYVYVSPTQPPNDATPGSTGSAVKTSSALPATSIQAQASRAGRSPAYPWNPCTPSAASGSSCASSSTP